MAIKILTSNEPASRQGVTLGGTPYEITTKYNYRNQSWYLDIRGNGKDILTGVKVVVSQNLTGRYPDVDLGGGDLLCLRIANDKTPIGFDNFGPDKSYALFWASSLEIEEANGNGKINF